MKGFCLEIRTEGPRKKDVLPGIFTPTPHGESSTQPLIKTKLLILHLRKDHVPRPHLLEKLQQGSKKTLTLISAPAGYGKNTLLAEWIDFLQQVDTPIPWAICWFSVDAGDNDPMRFLAYLMAAFEKVGLELSTETQEIIRSILNNLQSD